MEMWRWMWPNMGDLYVLANVPEFMLHVVKDGKVVFTEKIVAGEVGKQTSIFTRTLKHIVFRPKWRVPESIKVKELWPSLLRGGGLMKQYGLEVETKDGKPRDWRTMDWANEDIRNYEVLQAPGRKSVLGVVKFSFPSQHTIYMHDTPDRYMFAASQRTLSHGCLRLRNPVKLAELLLSEDKGWSATKIDDLIKNGPLNNEIAIERKIPMHIAYFTAWVDEQGKLATYRDVYGHEKRVGQALEGKWDQIAKGADHLVPVEPDKSAPARVAQTKPKQESFFDALSSAIGGGF
jgi:murein L,D-transpeptidase YcbB/YkuD